MKRSYFPRQCWALSGVLVVMALLFALAASAQAPSIEGTYQLISRKLPDGTVLKPPDIMGLQTYTKSGTFQNRAKVVDSLPGYTSGMAGWGHNLATRAKRSMKLSFSTDRTMRPLQSLVVGDRALKRLSGLRSLDLEPSPVDPSTHRC